ncbi:hypothetical protein OG439_38610 [Amycolatopsis sp. NBC_01307]|uniref:hypothetical protein n=1 Tax=Amycolatopsis sp. NBC_01307 TaxID=2903561 RepID=UPI002E15AA63|nr:hypothetical protein OG439_38610 [Amycolatopsis sp. NBC_01307]
MRFGIFLPYGVCLSAITLAAHVTVDGRPGPARDPGEYTERLCAIHPVGDAGTACGRGKRASGAPASPTC